jgi:hypothetical protein
MPRLEKDASADVITNLDAIERTADDCFRVLHILKYPSKVAACAVVPAAIMMIEDEQNARGSNTAGFDALLIKAGRFVPRWREMTSARMSNSARIMRIRNGLTTSRAIT